MPDFKQRGFSLIELLIVIAIIAILTALLFVAFSQIQRNSRDRQRQADINTVAAALQRFYSNHGQFPTASAGLMDVPSAACTSGTSDTREWGVEAFDCNGVTYMRQLPAAVTPPTGSYCYQTFNSNQGFELFAEMENNSNGNGGGTCNSVNYDYKISSRS